ncbi:hypothetical protein X777_16724 [Ooceraea biroi]|uniref:Uncharacterized protein n=1 Tax=Ooceraea biroi TaxID=2015173 RepID=A0A026WUL9_OOCBI|nr:hypothetical protein X777_16724 [Ooceraea biroi]
MTIWMICRMQLNLNLKGDLTATGSPIFFILTGFEDQYLNINFLKQYDALLKNTQENRLEDFRALWCLQVEFIVSRPWSIRILSHLVVKRQPHKKWDSIQEEAVDWEQHTAQLIRCKKCKRTFIQDRIQKHETCKKI